MFLDELVEQAFDDISEFENEHIYYTCPVCGRSFSLFVSDLSFFTHEINEDEVYDIIVFSCPFEDCQELIGVGYCLSWDGGLGHIEDKKVLFPEVIKNLKRIPSYVEHKIRDDYKETVKLATISPGASISYGRRTLERIILAKWPDVMEVKRVHKEQLPSLNEMIRYLEANQLYGDPNLLRQIKDIGNKATHVFSIDEDIKFTSSDSDLIIAIIELLINELFVNPTEADLLKKKIFELADAKGKEKKELEEKTLNKDNS